ncbi:MAG: TrpB-like pyridoxal phosphate-dependent enzyme [Candidatus Hodarchaeota archaeon]
MPTLSQATAQTRINLDQNELPKKWFNLLSVIGPRLAPPLRPDSSPITPDDLSILFPAELIRQEMSAERYITIPEPVREIYLRYRPSPLFRALKLEKAINSNARIYYKYEGGSPTGSHKPNTAIPQAYYNSLEGVERLTTETGAGQWGSALAYGAKVFDLALKVYMVRISYQQKPYRSTLMRLYGAECVPSPSDTTNFGRKLLAQDPDHPGSLGIAISEALEDAVTSGGTTKYSLGSVLNHVLLHQTIIGLEAEKQLALVEEEPDIVIGCVGGGSNFAGLAYPFAAQKIENHKPIKILAVEPNAAPKMSRGKFAYDFGDTAQMTPLLKMFTLGSTFVPPKVHAGGLRYHGSAPTLSVLLNDGIVSPRACAQQQVFESATLFASAEGIVPAPESAHAVHCAIEEARQDAAADKVILFNLSGHGLLDLLGYQDYLAGTLPADALSSQTIEKSLSDLPPVSVVE